VHNFLRAVVIDDPEEIGVAMRACQTTGFEDLVVFETTAGRKRCRLLCIRAAGNGQQ
tara:strand:- start:1288 stop:1458 length:171 start_codon:yes stop_codon:yes gene_type:complete